jgi:hypothetical protein
MIERIPRNSFPVKFLVNIFTAIYEHSYVELIIPTKSNIFNAMYTVIFA